MFVAGLSDHAGSMKIIEKKTHGSLLENLLSVEMISLLFTSFSVRVFTPPAELSRVLKPLSHRARRCRLGSLKIIIKHVAFPNGIKSDGAGHCAPR